MPAATPPSVPGPIEPPAPDDQHLKLLSIFYYISAGLSLIGACVGVVYVAFGIAILFVPVDPADASDPPVGLVSASVIGMGGFILVLTALSCTLQFLTARSIGQRRRRIFCLVVAAINCLSIPLGTILGVFTIIVLARPTVIAQFDSSRDPAPTLP